MKVLVTISAFTNTALDEIRKVADVDVVTPDQVEFATILANYDAVLVGLGLKLDADVLSKAKKLRIVATATTGLDHIDTKYCEQHGVAVLSLRGENEFLDSITGTSELAFALALNLMRHIPSSQSSVLDYKWEREKFRGHNMKGSTMGVLGVGRLGKQMIRYASAFGMNVLGHDPEVKVEEFGARAVTFEDLLKESDVISIHIHISDKNKDLFNLDAFRKMKKTAYLVNTSRGEIVKEEDLLTALNSGLIAGYATDVLVGENGFNVSFKDNLMVEHARNHNNLIIVPHIGGMTFESRLATDNFMAGKLVRAISSAIS